MMMCKNIDDLDANGLPYDGKMHILQAQFEKKMKKYSEDRCGIFSVIYDDITSMPSEKVGLNLIYNKTNQHEYKHPKRLLSVIFKEEFPSICLEILPCCKDYEQTFDEIFHHKQTEEVCY